MISTRSSTDTLTVQAIKDANFANRTQMFACLVKGFHSVPSHLVNRWQTNYHRVEIPDLDMANLTLHTIPQRWCNSTGLNDSDVESIL